MLRSIIILSVFVIVTSNVQQPLAFFNSKLSTSTRLSDQVLPTAYVLDLILNENFTSTKTFSGTVTISLNVTASVTSFQLHAKNLKLIDVSLTKESDIALDYSEIDENTDLVTVTFQESLEVSDKYKLKISYDGVLNDKSMVGFYLSSYINEFGQEKFVAVTQFEDMHARKAFPCFDEPGFKATFQVSMTYPKEYHFWANKQTSDPQKVDDVLVKSRIARTVKMSTYLVAFMIAPFNCKDGSPTINKVPVQLCSRISAFDQSAKLALDTAPKLINIMSNFTKHNYTEVGKMTLAAIPDFAPGAMENWGLITFREAYLLYDNEESSNKNKQGTVTVLAHEISHQWFGNLVTLHWWSSIFLNEGFATFFQYYAPDSLVPGWELTKQFVLEQLQSALESDSSKDSLPLSYDTDNAEYSSRINDVSYNKGASIIRMVYNFLGEDNFKLGIADYITANALSTATPEDLWNSFQPYLGNLPEGDQPPQPMSVIMDNWTTKSGYPVVNAKLVGNDVVIDQEEFSVDGSSNNTKWYIPVSYITTTNFTPTTKWLTPSSSETLSVNLQGSLWINLNNKQSGYFRVNYDEELLNRISNTLHSNINTIPEMNRVALIDDQFSLAKAGKKSFTEVLNFLDFLKSEDSYFTWYSAFNGFDYLLKKTLNTDSENYVKNFLKEHMQKLYESVAFGTGQTDQIYTLKQELALSWACKLGNDDCISTAKMLFVNYKNNSTNKLNANVKSVIYCNALRNSTTLIKDYQFLQQKYSETKVATERITILQALGCANDKFTRQNYLKSTTTESTVRLQDVRYVFESVYSNNPEGPEEVLNVIIDNHKDFIERFGDSSILNMVVLSLADYLNTQQQIDKLRSFSATDIDENLKNAVSKAISKAEKNLEDSKRIAAEIESANSSAFLKDIHYSINIICLIVVYFWFNKY